MHLFQFINAVYELNPFRVEILSFSASGTRLMFTEDIA